MEVAEPFTRIFIVTSVLEETHIIFRLAKKRAVCALHIGEQRSRMCSAHRRAAWPYGAGRDRQKARHGSDIGRASAQHTTRMMKNMMKDTLKYRRSKQDWRIMVGLLCRLWVEQHEGVIDAG